MRQQKYHALQESVKAEAVSLSGPSFEMRSNRTLRKASHGSARLSLIPRSKPFQLSCPAPTACLALEAEGVTAARLIIILL